MSPTQSGAQWDSPYGWAPAQILAIAGLHRYGFHADADRISVKFLSMVLENFRRDGATSEKYDVAARTSATKPDADHPQAGPGFAWTNAAFAELLQDLPKSVMESLEKAPSAPASK